jgi:hypothetical protein
MRFVEQCEGIVFETSFQEQVFLLQEVSSTKLRIFRCLTIEMDRTIDYAVGLINILSSAHTTTYQHGIFTK